MGSTFSNISVLKRNNSTNHFILKDLITGFLEEKGFEPVPKAGRTILTVIVCDNPQSKWVTIYFSLKDYMQEGSLSEYIAGELDTYSLFIINMDSNFISLSLFGNSKEDDVMIGNARGVAKNAYGNMEQWKPVTRDTTKLSKIFHDKYLFSEDILPALEGEIGIQAEDINFSPFDDVRSISNQMEYSTFHFKFNMEKKLFIKKGPAQLQRVSFTHPHINSDLCFSYCNRGGKSKGIAVVLTGSFIGNRGITIRKVLLQRRKDLNKEIFSPGNDLNYIKDTEKGITDEKETFLYAVFPDFEIPEGIINSCENMMIIKLRSKHEYYRHIILRFLPEGPEGSDISDLQVKMIPLENIHNAGKVPSDLYERALLNAGF